MKPGMERRAFIGTTSLAVAGLTIPHSLFPIPRRRIGRVGLQLYTVRGLMKQDFEGTLAKVAQIGYREVEFAGYFDHTPTDVRAILDRHGLASPGAHVSYESDDQWKAALDGAKTIGHEYIVMPWIAPERRTTLDDWKNFAQVFNHAG